MANLSSKRTRTRAPVREGEGVRVTDQITLTHEGALAFVREPKGELFVLGASMLFGEPTFYEGADERAKRFVKLVRDVSADDPEWAASFIRWLRHDAFIRTASVVAVAEYAAIRAPNARQLINQVLARPDEPAELLAYWVQAYGKPIPQRVKRGVADAVTRMYDQRAALRYDGRSRAWRMGDVIELTHPRPRDASQSALFKYLLDRRHHDDWRTETYEGLLLPRLADRAYLNRMETTSRREALRENPDWCIDTLGSWEALSGWLQDEEGMDREAWEAAIPHMGYMALLRNLRNFDEADISDVVFHKVSDRLADPKQVAKSKQFPYRFLSAWNATSARWGYALERAADLSMSNVPALPGRTLLLLDDSGSMTWGFNTLMPAMIAGMFGAVLAQRADEVDVWAFSNSARRIDQLEKRGVLKAAEWFVSQAQGGGTYLGQALDQAYREDTYDRVIIVSDYQIHDDIRTSVDCPVYAWNVNGYRATPLRVGKDGVIELGGFSDSAFKIIQILEDGFRSRWPWQ